MLMVHNLDAMKFLKWPHDRAGKRIGCVDPGRSPPQCPVYRPQQEKKIVQLLPQTALHKSNSFDMDLSMSRQLNLGRRSIGNAEKKNLPSSIGKEARRMLDRRISSRIGVLYI